MYLCLHAALLRIHFAVTQTLLTWSQLQFHYRLWRAALENGKTHKAWDIKKRPSHATSGKPEHISSGTSKTTGKRRRHAKMGNHRSLLPFRQLIHDILNVWTNGGLTLWLLPS